MTEFDESELSDVLSELEEERSGFDVAEMPEKEAAEVKRPLSVASVASDEEATAFVQWLHRTYPGYVEISSHWTFGVIAAMSRSKYKPRRHLAYNPNLFKTDLGHIEVATKHLSKIMLDDLKAHITKTTTLPYERVDSSTFFETEDGAMAYSDGETKVEKSNSETQIGWASW